MSLSGCAHDINMTTVIVRAGIAAAELAQAAEHAAACANRYGHFDAAWKLLGDIHLQHHAVTPASAVGLGPEKQ